MEPAVLRILDANANRAREALRVLEDAARFALDDADLSLEAKQIRHQLAAACGALLADAVACRDTPGDVGTRHTTPAEQRRAGLPEVAVAAGKRAGEALRALEECLKIAPGDAAAQVEALRYRLYDLERRLLTALRPAGRLGAARLCVLVTSGLCRADWLATAERAIDGGADMIQLREKEMEAGDLLARARRLVALCRARDVLCIINDRPDIALLSGADGVHLGQTDLPAREARRLLGARALIGVSTHEPAQARAAAGDGADYLGVGPAFVSATKPRAILPGPAYLSEAARLARRPTFAIGGIDAGNVAVVAATGVSGIAVSRAVIAADDPAEGARRLRAAFVAAQPSSDATRHATKDT